MLLIGNKTWPKSRWGEGIYTPCWFSLLVFCSIQYLSIRDIPAKFGIPNLPHSTGFGRHSYRGLSNFQISSLSSVNKNWHDTRISNDVNMKLGPMTKLGKRNTAMSKKIDDDDMSASYDVIDIVFFYGQFWAIWMPVSGRTVCDCYVLINSNHLSYKK